MLLRISSKLEDSVFVLVRGRAHLDRPRVGGAEVEGGEGTPVVCHDGNLAAGAGVGDGALCRRGKEGGIGGGTTLWKRRSLRTWINMHITTCGSAHGRAT